jgi:hypothetical protein
MRRSVVLFVLALLAAAVATHLLGFGVWGNRIDALNSDSEGGVFQWLGTLAVLAAALGAALHRRLLLAALLAFLFVGGVLHLSDSMAHWALVYAPVLALAALLLWRDGSTEVRVGVVVLALSLGIHELGPPLLARLGWGPADWAYQVKIAFKQGTQLVGWALVATALLRRGQNRVGKLVEQPRVPGKRIEAVPLAERDPVELVG